MSPQTNYEQDSRFGMPGLCVDTKVGYVESAAAEEVIPFGVLAVEHATDPEIVRLPGANTLVVTDDGGTYTAGNYVATINGVTVTVAFDTDKATTLGNVATALAALNFVASATYAAGSDTITVVAQANRRLTMTVDLSGITGDMTIDSIVGSISEAIKGLTVLRTSEYGQTRNTNNDQVVMTLSGDTLTTDDTVDGVINGVAIDQVTYATSEAATLQLVANAILEVPGVAAAVVNSTARTITISNNPTLLMENASLTVDDDALAATAPTFAATYSKQPASVAVNETVYLAGETVGAQRQGKVWCLVEEAVAKGDSVFVRINTGTGTQRGAFRNDVDSGSCVAVSTLRFAGPSQTSSDGVSLIAPVEINLP